eukprot:NODE_103_length_20051_cov_0.229401.p3 type:complete len:620 gc:universal NODE_103_length_20051_cov_0.229401:19728-17869(-)
MNMDQIFYGSLECMDTHQFKHAIKILRSVILDKLIPKISSQQDLISQLSNECTNLSNPRYLASALNKSQSLLQSYSSIDYRMSHLDTQLDIIKKKKQECDSSAVEFAKSSFEAIYQNPVYDSELLKDPKYVFYDKPKAKAIGFKKKLHNMSTTSNSRSFIKEKRVKIDKIKSPALIFHKQPVISAIPEEDDESQSELQDNPDEAQDEEFKNTRNSLQNSKPQISEELTAFRIPKKRQFLVDDKLNFFLCSTPLNLYYNINNKGCINNDSTIISISKQITTNYNWYNENLVLESASDVIIPKDLFLTVFVPLNWLKSIITQIFALDGTSQDSNTFSGKLTICLADECKMLADSNMVGISSSNKNLYLFISNKLYLDTIPYINAGSNESTCILIISGDLMVNYNSLINVQTVVNQINGTPFLHTTDIRAHEYFADLNSVNSVCFNCKYNNEGVYSFLRNQELEVLYLNNYSDVGMLVLDDEQFKAMLCIQSINLGDFISKTAIVIVNDDKFRILRYKNKQKYYYLGDDLPIEDVELLFELFKILKENFVLCGKRWYSEIQKSDLGHVDKEITIQELIESTFCHDDRGFNNVRYIYKHRACRTPLVENCSLDDLLVKSGILE